MNNKDERTYNKFIKQNIYKQKSFKNSNIYFDSGGVNSICQTHLSQARRPDFMTHLSMYTHTHTIKCVYMDMFICITL